MDRERFLGAWRLRSMERFDADGNVAHPYGDHPVGIITYTPDGYMKVILKA